MKQGLIYTIIFTFIVCFVFVFLLSFVNEATAEKVAFNTNLEKEKTVLEAFGITYTDANDAHTKFQLVQSEKIQNNKIYHITIDGVSLYAKQFAGSGLWGTIIGILAVDESLSKIIGISFLSQNETPGLGGRITEAWFKNQLRGESIINGTVLVGRSQASDAGDSDKTNGKIDAITGATRTSDSINVILNKELQNLKSILGGKNE